MTGRRILFLLPTSGFGGAELHSLTLARHMLQRGEKPVVAFPFSSGTARIYQQCTEDGIPMLDMRIAPIPMLRPAESMVEQSRRLRSRLEFSEYDAVVIASPSPLTAAGLLDALADSKLPGLCIFHLVAEGLVIPKNIAISMLGALRADFRFVAVSEFSRDMLCKALDVEPSDGFVDFIDNGSRIELGAEDPGIFDEYADRTQLKIVTVGRIHQQKGGEHLIRAMPAVLDQFPDARFLWFGEGPQRRELEHLARELGVGFALRFPGYTSQAADVMRAADLVVLPTLYEGLSLTLLEAMHSGAAIVTTDASYQDRILTDGVNAGIVPVRDSQALAEKILTMLQDETLKQECQRNVLDLSVRYSEDRMLAEYVRLLDELTAASPSPALAAVDDQEPKARLVRISLREEASGAHRLVLTIDGEDQDLHGEALLQDVATFLTVADRIELYYEFADIMEVWVAPQSTAAFLTQAQSWAGLLLDLMALDRWQQSARALTAANFISDAFASLSPGPTAESLIEAWLRFWKRHDFGLAASWAPLPRLRDKDLRAYFIRRHIAESAPSPRASAEASAQIPDLSRAERALFREEWARLHGDMASTLKYETLRAALEGRPLARPPKPRALFFAEYFNYPPINGGDRRMLSLIQSYQKLGFEVHFCGFAPSRLAAARAEQAAQMRDKLGVEAHYIKISDAYDKTLRDAHAELTLGVNVISKFYDAQAWRDLRALAEFLTPSLIHVNYCYFAWAASIVEGMACHRVMDTHDLISRRLLLNKELLRFCGQRRPGNVTEIPSHIHDPDRFAALRYNMLNEEIEALSQCDTVLMISPGEADTVRPMLSGDTVRPLEMYVSYAPALSTEPARRKIRGLYAGGNNLYNMTGAAALRNHVIPYLEKRLDDPTEFSLRISGDVENSVPPHDMIELIGRISDIELAYADVDFAICPIPAGTGQNVKIVEALSHGIPVVTYQAIGRSANVIHGVNGLLAGTLSELRDLTAELIQDREQLAALKQSTRAWARQKFLAENFHKTLKHALANTGFNFLTLEGAS